MVSKEFGRMTDLRFEQPANVYAPIAVTVLGMSMLVKGQPTKALVPIETTDLGMEKSDIRRDNDVSFVYDSTITVRIVDEGSLPGVIIQPVP